jgi:hypothetical protein
MVSPFHKLPLRPLAPRDLDLCGRIRASKSRIFKNRAHVHIFLIWLERTLFSFLCKFCLFFNPFSPFFFFNNPTPVFFSFFFFFFFFLSRLPPCACECVHHCRYQCNLRRFLLLQANILNFTS